MIIKPIAPSPGQLAARRQTLRMNRRAGAIIRWCRPLGVARLVHRQLKRNALQAPLGMPLALLDGCGFVYPDLEVDPSLVTTNLRDWCAAPECGVFNSIDYFSLAGEWVHIVNQPQCREIEREAMSLLAAGLVYQDSEVYQQLLDTIRSGQGVRRQGVIIADQTQLDAYFTRFCTLFQSIQNNGMLTSADLDRASLRTNLDRALGVALDKDGRLHRLQGGNHRWAIAKVLGFTHVPVQLRLVHQTQLAQYG